MKAATALASERRAPSIAAVESAYAVFQIKRDIAGLKRWQRVLFRHAWLPLMRFCVLRLGLPLVEKIDRVKCQHCGFNISIENGGCWTEKEGIVTTREMALAACKNSDWYFHKLKVNAVMTGETAKTRLDHDFPLANTNQYRRASTDAGPVTCPYKRTPCIPEEVISRSEIQPLFDQVKEVDRALNR